MFATVCLKVTTDFYFKKIVFNLYLIVILYNPSIHVSKNIGFPFANWKNLFTVMFKMISNKTLTKLKLNKKN